ncbi:MAG TPA: hypothetical protein VM364_23265 [Vicinamibacterales bacterium]|nr:hypothetical protein [Vicinamibacterales bacterium]
MAPDADDASALAAQDEILQVLFWLRGERLADDATAAELLRFTAAPQPLVERTLERLCAIALLQRVAGDGAARYALTPEGEREAGRRFKDEFADLTRPGHGECGDPECDCRTTGRLEDCSHRH